MKLFLVGLTVLFFSMDLMAKEVLLVGNNGEGTISVIDTSNYSKLCTLNVVPDLEQRKKEWSLKHKIINSQAGTVFADDLKLSPDGKILYVSRGSVNDVAAFELPSMKMLWRTEVKGDRADHLTISPDGKYIFVAALLDKHVLVIDPTNGKAITKIKTGDRPHVLKHSNDGSKLYIGEMKGNSLTVADANNFKVLGKIKFAEGVRPFVFTKDDSKAYVQLSFFNGFVEYDLKNMKLATAYSLPETDKSRSYKGKYPKDAAHHGMAISLDEKYLCVAGTVSDYVAMVSLPNLATEKIIQVGEMPGWAINSSDGKYCYVSSKVSNTVSVISYDTLEEIKRIAVGVLPQRMVVAEVSEICSRK
jgi:YVTN family beta-propeller protein